MIPRVRPLFHKNKFTTNFRVKDELFSISLQTNTPY